MARRLEPGVVTFNDLDLISGWRYSATLPLRTPLVCLEMDGEFSPGPKSLLKNHSCSKMG
jgi:hypothetical protein